MSSVLLTAHLVKTLRHPWVPIGLTSLQPETLCCFLFLICYLQTKTSFFFFFIPSLLPRSHMSLSRLTPSSPPLCFHFKMFDFTYYLLLWFWAPAMLTCSSSPSLPPCLSHAILGHTFMRGLCCSLYLPSFYCLANSYSSEVARVSEGSPL